MKGAGMPLTQAAGKLSKNRTRTMAHEQEGKKKNTTINHHHCFFSLNNHCFNSTEFNRIQQNSTEFNRIQFLCRTPCMPLTRTSVLLITTLTITLSMTFLLLPRNEISVLPVRMIKTTTPNPTTRIIPFDPPLNA
jgi:hypothetical protein